MKDMASTEPSIPLDPDFFLSLLSPFAFHLFPSRDFLSAGGQFEDG
jgi:hypothetical protein